MKKINDGGPAFPVADLSKTQCAGASLRDLFAAMAMQAMLDRLPTELSDRDELAEHAYGIADAMIAFKATAND